MIGLNGYTLCSGIMCEELNGSDYCAIKLKSDEIMTGWDAASVREHVLSPEEYLSQIEFLDDDFEFQHKDGFEHVDTNFASQSYWKEAIARFKKNKGAMFSFV